MNRFYGTHNNNIILHYFMSGNYKINEIKFDPNSYSIDISLLHINDKIQLFIKSMFVRDKR